jgi:hypothetical protein
MHITNYQPVAIGAALTTGNIGKLADHAAQARENIVKLDGLLADLNRRLDCLEKQQAASPPLLIREAP